MKNILKREYNKVKRVSQIVFHIFCIFLILILRLFLLIIFPEKKLSKTKSYKENVFVLYHKLHNFYQSLDFLYKPFKIEGLVFRIYRSSQWGCSRDKKMFLEITVAIFKNNVKVAMWICGKSTWKISVKNLSFCKFAGLQRVTRLKIKYFTNIVQGFWSYILEHLFFQTPLTSRSRFTYICTLYTQSMTLQLVSLNILIWRPHQK